MKIILWSMLTFLFLFTYDAHASVLDLTSRENFGEIISLIAFAIWEFFIGKTKKVNAASTIELGVNIFKKALNKENKI